MSSRGKNRVNYNLFIVMNGAGKNAFVVEVRQQLSKQNKFIAISDFIRESPILQCSLVGLMKKEKRNLSSVMIQKEST